MDPLPRLRAWVHAGYRGSAARVGPLYLACVRGQDAVVRPLAAELRGRGLRVWYDEFELKIGDSLRGRIEDGLARSARGVVVISPSFFAKHWTLEELAGLSAREAASGGRRLLPIWHDVSRADVAARAPMLADRFAASTTTPIPDLAVQIIEALRADGSIGSEMDALVKWALAVRDVGVVGDAVHGGGWWGRAAGARATTTVTLRYAGRNRRTVSGRELPRTNVASRNRIDPIEDPPGGLAPAARPHHRVAGRVRRRPPGAGRG
ncbi:MAG: toll/interleukin-1 receptor domain-containing protein [Actinobacteria bacterium]|nr:toll/interleukin-1 receptor domain-containing protein [Actinomycetota bacterium]